jgi:hypothetical protein
MQMLVRPFQHKGYRPLRSAGHQCLLRRLTDALFLHALRSGHACAVDVFTPLARDPFTSACVGCACHLGCKPII